MKPSEDADFYKSEAITDMIDKAIPKNDGLDDLDTIINLSAEPEEQVRHELGIADCVNETHKAKQREAQLQKKEYEAGVRLETLEKLLTRAKTNFTNAQEVQKLAVSHVSYMQSKNSAIENPFDDEPYSEAEIKAASRRADKATEKCKTLTYEISHYQSELFAVRTECTGLAYALYGHDPDDLYDEWDETTKIEQKPAYGAN